MKKTSKKAELKGIDMSNHEEAHKEHINKYKMAHSIGVAEYMRERAVDYGLEPDTMYVVGLLHDIGYLNGRANHEENGAVLLGKTFGFDTQKEDVLFAVLHHGDNPYDVMREYGEESISPVFVLLLEGDMSVEKAGYRVGFEKRLKDIGDRYGYDSVAYHRCEDNIAFIKEYQREHNIGKPLTLYHKHKNEFERD